MIGLTMNTLTYCLLQDPPLMLIIASFVAVALYVPLTLGTLYFRYHGVDERITPGRVTSVLLWTCGLTVTLISPAAFLLAIAVKQGWLEL